jgi:hypothetical protein
MRLSRSVSSFLMNHSIQSSRQIQTASAAVFPLLMYPIRGGGAGPQRKELCILFRVLQHYLVEWRGCPQSALDVPIEISQITISANRIHSSYKWASRQILFGSASAS